MKEVIKLSDQEIGDAIVQYIAQQRGINLFPDGFPHEMELPYSITKISHPLANEVEFELRLIPRQFRGTREKDFPHHLTE